MTEPLKKVASGDPLKIPAQTFNTFIDAARDFRARQQGRTQNARQTEVSMGFTMTYIGAQSLCAGGR